MSRTIRTASILAVALGVWSALPAGAARGVRSSAVRSVSPGYGGTVSQVTGVGTGAYADTSAVSHAGAARTAAVYGNNLEPGYGIDRRAVGDVDVRRDVVVDPDYGCCYDEHPVARAAVAAAGAVAIGSLYYELPSGCTTVVVDGYTYEQCGDTWYEPQMSSYETYYIVVNPPQ